MVNGPLLVTVLFSVLLSGLGVVTLLRNARERINKQFFFFAVTVSAWLVLNYIAATPNVGHEVALLANRYVLVAGGFAILLLLSFVLHLANWQGLGKWYISLVWLNIIAWSLCITPWVVENVSFKDGQVINQFGRGAVLYFFALFVTFLAVVVGLGVGHYRLTGIRKKQLDSLSRSILVATPIILACTAVLPILGYYGLVNYAPLALAIIVGTMFYVIAKHRLFNLRLVIVRSLAYVLSLGIISVAYAVVAHYLLVHFEHQNTNAALADLINIALIITVVVTYRPLKSRFDKVTNRFFYRDAYDSRIMLDKLNQTFISTVQLEDLLEQTANIIGNDIKANGVSIYIEKGQHSSLKEVGQRIDRGLVKKLYNYMTKRSLTTILVDDLPDTYIDLREACITENILLFGRITHDSQGGDAGIGYLALGAKRSGNPYNSYDQRTINAVVKELFIGIQNALQFQEIQNFNETLQNKIDSATYQLRKANQRLRSIDETKDEFITMASHQLRTPLTSVKGYLSMVLEGDAGTLNKNQEKLLQQSYISSQRMVYLISDLLNLSRLNTGKFVIEPSPVDLNEVIVGEVEQLKETAKSRDLEIEYHKPEHCPMLMLDETKIHQVVMNFLDNAIYYTPPGGKIKVELHETPTSVEYLVKDNGIGVPRSEQRHLFSKFYRANNAKRARPDGTGLGLFMAKKVIAAQGGSIIFESEEGKGSTFGFRFTKANHAVPAADKPKQAMASAA